jgi:hypothetical protein
MTLESQPSYDDECEGDEVSLGEAEEQDPREYVPYEEALDSPSPRASPGQGIREDSPRTATVRTSMGEVPLQTMRKPPPFRTTMDVRGGMANDRSPPLTAPDPHPTCLEEGIPPPLCEQPGSLESAQGSVWSC